MGPRGRFRKPACVGWTLSVTLRTICWRPSCTIVVPGHSFVHFPVKPGSWVGHDEGMVSGRFGGTKCDSCWAPGRGCSPRATTAALVEAVSVSVPCCAGCVSGPWRMPRCHWGEPLRAAVPVLHVLLSHRLVTSGAAEEPSNPSPAEMKMCGRLTPHLHF